MSAIWVIKRTADEARAIQLMGYRPIHRDLNRRRSRVWRRIWMKLARGMV